MNPRIAPLEPPFSPEVAEHLQKLMPAGVDPLTLFRVVAHNPRVLGRMRRGGLLDPGSISMRQRELIILRTTARCRSEYEWGVHAAFFGGAAGLTEEQLTATARGTSSDPLWSREDSLLIALADALHDAATVDASLWADLEEVFDEAQLVELLFLAGLYHAVSFVTNATKLPPEDGAPRFPAEQRCPSAIVFGHDHQRVVR